MERKESAFLEKWRDSSYASVFLGILVVDCIITLCAMTVSFLVMLFSSGEDGMRYCFFKTIYFNSITEATGNISMKFGFTGEVFPIFFFAGAIFVFMFGTYYFAKRLLQYRQYLIKAGYGNR